MLKSFYSTNETTCMYVTPFTTIPLEIITIIINFYTFSHAAHEFHMPRSNAINFEQPSTNRYNLFAMHGMMHMH